MEDGYYDAFRHAMWSAMMTRAHGACKADWVGTGHEENIVGGNHPQKKEMDLHNNQVGRTAAEDLRNSLGRDPTNAELAEEIHSRLAQGKGKVIDKTGSSDVVVASSSYEAQCPE